MSTVQAIVVTFDPARDRLDAALSAVRPQVERVLIVDNGSHDARALRAVSKRHGAVLHENGENRGIAAAQNFGIERALRAGAKHVLLLDQDTVLARGSVAAMLGHLDLLRQKGERVAAVGPAHLDARDGAVAKARRARGLAIGQFPVAGDAPVEADFLTASGSMLPLEAIETVGAMEEGLFIDLVDVEWGLRARASGYRSFIVPGIVSDHALGTGRIQVPGRRITVHAPVRDYYWTRNALKLARRRAIHPAWRLFFARRALAHLATYPLLADRRMERLRLISRGLRDGLLDREGPLQPAARTPSLSPE